jgi:glycosyltransferase involved in cell wall biosynthesis
VVHEIAEADVCICPLPDRLEWNVSSPLKVFEYMACSKPMILTPIPAHEDVVGGSRFVVWTQGFEPKDFRDAILQAVARRDDLKVAAAGAPDVIKGRYEWCAQANNLHRYLASRVGQTPLVDRETSPQTYAEAEA